MHQGTGFGMAGKELGFFVTGSEPGAPLIYRFPPWPAGPMALLHSF